MHMLRKKEETPHSTCELSRLVLSKLIDSKFSVKLDKIAEASQQNSYLCRQCDTNLHKIYDLEQQLMKLKEELNSLLSFLHHLMRLAMLLLVQRERRHLVSACSSTPKCPHIRLDCPSYQRHDHQTKSFHHFHSYVVRDQNGLTCSSNISKPPSVNPEDNCCVLITR